MITRAALTCLLKNVFCSFQGSPCEDRNFRSDVDDTETDEASVSGQEDSGDNIDILEWAKVSIYLLFNTFLYHIVWASSMSLLIV